MSKELRENIEANQELREQLESEPWISLRNRLVFALAGKRRELGVSQADLAKAMNTPHSSITRFESLAVMKKGKPVSPPNPTLKYLASYAAALGLDIEFQLVPAENRKQDLL
jgi:transcriptional regulator with XRE-family HTH domain